jgi:hypothetical protein
MTVQSLEGTCVDEIADGIFRISTPVTSIAGGSITYNQYLLVDDEPFSPEVPPTVPVRQLCSV